MRKHPVIAGLLWTLASLVPLPAVAIVNGTVSNLWPAVGTVVYRPDATSVFVCTAFEIDYGVAVTAAHCLPSPDVSKYQFTTFDGPAEHTYQITSFEVEGTADVGLVHFPGSLLFVPFKLNSKALGAGDIGRKVDLLGWGLTAFDDNSPLDRRLGRTTLDTVTSSAVTTGYSPSGTCYGDDGAPVFGYDPNGFPVAFAVSSSFGNNCVAPDTAERVDAILSFIEAHSNVCLDGQSCEGIFRNRFEDPL